MLKLDMDKTYKKLCKLAKQVYKNEPTGHDFSHIKRCLKNAKKIEKAENLDENQKFLLNTAILFHDIHRVVSTNEKHVTAKEAMPYVRKTLAANPDISIDKKSLEKIFYLIENHDNKSSDIEIPKELIILQDADLLDAIGKIGLKRTKTYCKKRNIPFFDERYPLDIEDYLADIKPYSTTHYVYRTMLPEMQFIKTEMGKKLAKRQAKPLQKFVEKNSKKASYTK